MRVRHIFCVRANIFWQPLKWKYWASPQYSEQSAHSRTTFPLHSNKCCMFTYRFPSALLLQLQQVLHAEPQMTRLTVPLNILNKECAHSRNNSPLRIPLCSNYCMLQVFTIKWLPEPTIMPEPKWRSETWSSAFFESWIWCGWLFPSMNNECAYSRKFPSAQKLQHAAAGAHDQVTARTNNYCMRSFMWFTV